MEFSEITLGSKAEFDHYISLHNPQISELTFTNFFTWRHFYRFRYSVISDLLCVISVPCRGEPFAMMPLGDVNGENFSEAYSRLKKYFDEKGWRLVFRKITARETEFFKERVASEASIVYDRDNSDYLYRTDDLINLRGKKFDGKRNHINKFKKLYTYEYVPLGYQLLDECVRIMEQWCADKDCECRNGEYCERKANLELLENFGALDYKGALVKVDGVYEAFTAGEMLNENTAVIHVEKARSSVKGLYAFINQQFAEKEWPGTTYINREQDLGLEGMRKAKLSYHPVRLIEKYTVYPV
ncbi:MAG: DUF2156 domain-containing protein [Acetivibrionales bacterium]